MSRRCARSCSTSTRRRCLLRTSNTCRPQPCCALSANRRAREGVTTLVVAAVLACSEEPWAAGLLRCRCSDTCAWQPRCGACQWEWAVALQCACYLLGGRCRRHVQVAGRDARRPGPGLSREPRRDAHQCGSVCGVVLDAQCDRPWHGECGGNELRGLVASKRPVRSSSLLFDQKSPMCSMSGTLPLGMISLANIKYFK